MISLILALFRGIGFYWRAKRYGRSALSWALLGAAVFFFISLLSWLFYDRSSSIFESTHFWKLSWNWLDEMIPGFLLAYFITWLIIRMVLKNQNGTLKSGIYNLSLHKRDFGPVPGPDQHN